MKRVTKTEYLAKLLQYKDSLTELSGKSSTLKKGSMEYILIRSQIADLKHEIDTTVKNYTLYGKI